MPKYFNSVTFLRFCLVGNFCLLYALLHFHLYFLCWATLLLYLCIMIFWSQLQPAMYKDFLIHWRPMDGLGLTFSFWWNYCLFDIYTISDLVIFDFGCVEGHFYTLYIYIYILVLKVWWPVSDLCWRYDILKFQVFRYGGQLWTLVGSLSVFYCTY